MLTYSEIFKRYYDTEDGTPPIVNIKQAGLYIKNNCPLLDLYWADGSLVFIFDKKASRQFYEAWKNFELQ